MVKIRLKRMGYKRNPVFRIVVMNSTVKRDGRPIQELGFYNPKRKEMRLDKESALEWIKKGAQPTETVHQKNVFGLLIETACCLPSSLVHFDYRAHSNSNVFVKTSFGVVCKCYWGMGSFRQWTGLWD